MPRSCLGAGSQKQHQYSNKTWKTSCSNSATTFNSGVFIISPLVVPFFQQSEKAHCNQMQPMNLYGIETNLRRLRTLLRPADKPIFIGLSFAGEAVDLRVRSQGAFVVNVTAANSSDTPCVHWLTAVLYFGHGREAASWLAGLAHVSKLVDSAESKLLLSICCRIKQQRRHDFPTRL